jgi:hypothetical protein
MKKESRKKSRTVRLLKVLAYTGGITFALVFIPLAVLIVPDQVRRIPEPSTGDWMWRTVESDAKPDNVSTRSGGEPSVPRAVAEKKDESARESDEREVFSVSEKALKERRPISDVSELPEEKRSAAEKLNSAFDEMTTELLALLKAQKDMTYADAESLFFRFVKTHTRTYRDIPRKDFSAERADSIMELYRESVERAFLQICVDHKKWQEAAAHCMNLVHLKDTKSYIPNKKSPWWPHEVYCWRKGGLQGRWKLAFRSASVVIIPVSRVIDSVQPLRWLRDKIRGNPAG